MSQGFLKKREAKIVRMDGDRFAFEGKEYTTETT